MSLAEFTPERITVEFKGKPLVQVRGFNLDDVSVLIRNHADIIQQLYETLDKPGATLLQVISVDGFIIKLITDAPLLAATGIALACDEPGEVDRARMLPVPVQVMILQAVLRLTFEDIGGPKGFAALVGELVRKQLPSLRPAA